MLAPVATVPHTLAGEVPTDRGRLFVSLAAPNDLLTLLLAGGTDRELAQLDAAAVDALRALLDDAAGRMAAANSSAIAARLIDAPSSPTPDRAIVSQSTDA